MRRGCQTVAFPAHAPDVDRRMTDTGFTRTSLAPVGDERFVSLRRPLELSAFGMNLILLAPGQRGRIHDHERQEEVYLVWEGVLTLIVEGEAHDLARGEIARVGPGVRRQLVNLGPGRCCDRGARRHSGRTRRARRPRLGVLGRSRPRAAAAGGADARRPARVRAPQLAPASRAATANASPSRPQSPSLPQVRGRRADALEVMRIRLPGKTCTGVLVLALPLLAAASSGPSWAGSAGGEALQINVKDFAIKAPRAAAGGHGRRCTSATRGRTRTS